jgi:phosphinothricin acetyltransferase
MEQLIRLVSADDAEEIRAIYAPYVRESAISFERTPPTVEDIRQRILDIEDSHPWLVCEHEGRVVGYAYAGSHRTREAYQWSVESSVYVHNDCHRSGIARGLYTSLLDVLNLQGYQNVYAGTTLPNPASAGFHEAMGFELIGVYENVGAKNGEWHDVEWRQLSLGDHPSSPAPPLSISEAQERERWDEALSAGAPAIQL